MAKSVEAIKANPYLLVGFGMAFEEVDVRFLKRSLRELKDPTRLECRPGVHHPRGKWKKATPTPSLATGFAPADQIALVTASSTAFKAGYLTKPSACAELSRHQ